MEEPHCYASTWVVTCAILMQKRKREKSPCCQMGWEPRLGQRSRYGRRESKRKRNFETNQNEGRDSRDSSLQFSSNSRHLDIQRLEKSESTSPHRTSSHRYRTRPFHCRYCCNPRPCTRSPSSPAHTLLLFSIAKQDLRLRLRLRRLHRRR